MQPDNNQHLIGSRVIYTGYSFTIEATIIASKTEQRGSIAITEVLLETDAGIRMWRGLSETQSAPAVAVLDDVEVIEDAATYYGTVVGIQGSSITVRTEDDEFIRCDASEVRRVLAKAV